VGFGAGPAKEHRANGAAQRERLAPLVAAPFKVHECSPLFGHGLDLEAIARGA
jgi:hypothetical protein